MTPPFTRRRFDAIVSHLYALGVLDGEDLVLMHNLPVRERLPYLRARAQGAVACSERLERLKHSVEGWT